MQSILKNLHFEKFVRKVIDNEEEQETNYGKMNRVRDAIDKGIQLKSLR